MSDLHPWNNQPIVREYSRLASNYDDKWSFYIRATTQETLNRFKLQLIDRVLDIGLRSISPSIRSRTLQDLSPTRV